MPTFWKQFKLNYTHNRGKKSASETAIKTVAVFFRSLLFGAAFKLPFLIVLHNNSMQPVCVFVCLRVYVFVGTEPKPQKSERDKRKNELDKKMWYKNLQCTKCVIKQRLLSPLLSLSRSPPLSLPCGRWDNPWAWPGRTLRTFQCIFYAARGRSHVCNWCCSWCASSVCVCVYQFTASLHTVQENQNGNHENQHPAAAAQAAASGKCKVNFVEGHASSRTEQ